VELVAAVVATVLIIHIQVVIVLKKTKSGKYNILTNNLFNFYRK